MIDPIEARFGKGEQINFDEFSSEDLTAYEGMRTRVETEESYRRTKRREMAADRKLNEEAGIANVDPSFVAEEDREDLLAWAGQWLAERDTPEAGPTRLEKIWTRIRERASKIWNMGGHPWP